MTEQSPEPPTPPESTPPDVAESRWRRYEAVVRARLEAANKAAESRRTRSLLIDSAFLIRDRNRILPISLLVGALASRIVIYIVPLFAVVIFGFGLYGRGSSAQAGEAATNAGMPELVAQAAGDSVAFHDGIKVAAFVATLWAALYAANSLGRLVRRSSAIVWGVPYPRMSRRWVLPLSVIGLTLVGWAVSDLSFAVEEWNFELLVGVVVAEGILLVIFWVLVSRLLPHDPDAEKWTNFLPGAILLAVGVESLRLGMIVYFAPAAEHLSARYGSIAIALVMLTWAYWLGMIVVGSAELNAALFQSRRVRRTRAEAAAETDKTSTK